MYKYKSEVELFIEECKTYREGMDLIEYFEDVCKYLMVCSYGCSLRNALLKVIMNKEYIKEAYLRKEPVDECAIEVGYSCG